MFFLAAVAAVTNWVAVARNLRRIEYVAKPATLLALIAAAVAIEPYHPAAARWFLVALALSLAGDVFLMLPHDLFIPGLASFLAAHLAYIVGLRVEGGGVLALSVAVVPVTAVALVVGRPIINAVRRRNEPGLTPAVVAYMTAISVMVTAAIASGRPLAGVGAALFFASDAMIAWNRFVAPFAGARVAIMITYHLGQAGLVLSLAV